MTNNIFCYNLRPLPLLNQNEVASEKFGEEEMEWRKKPRAKLTKEQKERMSAFAERLRWKSPRHNDEEIR